MIAPTCEPIHKHKKSSTQIQKQSQDSDDFFALIKENNLLRVVPEHNMHLAVDVLSMHHGNSQENKSSCIMLRFPRKMDKLLFFVDVKTKPVWLCEDVLVLMRRANLERHYGFEHAKQSELEGQTCLDKVNALQLSFSVLDHILTEALLHRQVLWEQASSFEAETSSRRRSYEGVSCCCCGSASSTKYLSEQNFKLQGRSQLFSCLLSYVK